MSSNPGVQFHMRFVTEKHQALIQSLDELVNILVGENLDRKKEKAEITLQRSNDLKSAVSTQDCPGWLPGLIQGLIYFKNGTWAQIHLMEHIIKNTVAIKSHAWVFDNSEDKAFDFDSIFEHYKSESRLPELFDEIIRILVEIEGSGEVDSLAMISALGKVIATLKKNRNGSYFSINSAWEFLISFLKNYMWAELSNIPVLGNALGALEKTIKETNEEMFKVHAKVQEEMARTVESEVKGLQDKAQFRFLGYDKSGVVLNEKTTLLPVDETV